MTIYNGTTPTLLFVMADADGVAVTGLSPTVTVSKNGGAFGAATNSPAEISSGFYKIALTATETDTNGDFGLLATGAGAIDFRQIYQVETTPNNFDPATEEVDIGKVTGTTVTDVGDFKADVSALATAANLTIVDTNVDTILGQTTPLTLTAIADMVLGRDISLVAVVNDYSLINGVRLLRNKRYIDTGILYVKKEDGTTNAWTANVTQLSSDPVTSVDPI